MTADTASWLSRTIAQEIVDSYLPGRTYENSLFRHLISEGLLAEDLAPIEVERQEPVDAIRFSYERLSDHLIANGHRFSAVLKDSSWVLARFALLPLNNQWQRPISVLAAVVCCLCAPQNTRESHFPQLPYHLAHAPSKCNLLQACHIWPTANYL